MLRRETPVWANAFACCGGEAEAGFPDPLKAQQTNYNLHKSGILRSSACGEGISFATANELSCLNTNPLHSTSLRSWRCRKHKAFDSCFQPGGVRLADGHCVLPCTKDPTDLDPKGLATKMPRSPLGGFRHGTWQLKSPGPCILSPLPPA